MSKNLARWMVLVAVSTLLVALLIAGQGLAAFWPTPNAALGEKLYFDTRLSEPDGQSCASCHEPGFGFVDPDKGLPVSEGVIPGLFGGGNSPAAAYAMYAPIRYFDCGEGLWIGGQFWDSRATGEDLGDPLADQALGPFLNPVEMANPDEATVVRDALNGAYGTEFEDACGTDVFPAYDCIALSIGLFERTALFGQFSSKYDTYLQACLALGGDKDDCAQGIGGEAAMAGSDTFTKKEWAGLLLFVGENDNNGTLDPGEGAMCSACHVAAWTPDPGNVVVPAWSPDGSVPPVFTDFTYDNLGVPKSTHKLLRHNPVDLGLGPIVMDSGENGKFKVMTLRNIGVTKPYAHNGYFMNLKDITHFYNTRDVEAEDWPPPEYPATVNTDELGDLGLSAADEDALVKFMKTLTDK